MAVSLPMVLAVVLAGCAAGGAVTSPGASLRRIHGGRSRGRSAAAPAPWSRRGVPLLAPRPGAPPRSQRYALAAAAAVGTVLGGQLMVPGSGSSAWLLGPPVAVIGAVLLGRLESPATRRQRLQMTVQLPQTLELLGAAMQAGLPLRRAVGAVVAVTGGPLAEDLAGVLAGIDLGIPESRAWRDLRDHPVLARVAVDLARSVDSGTMIVATLRRHAQLARRDRRGALEARARTVGVKSVPPLMLCFVPAFLAVSVVPIVVTAIGRMIG